MNSATLTKPGRVPRNEQKPVQPAVQSTGLGPWSFFLVAGLVTSIAAVVLLRGRPPAAIGLVIFTVAAAGLVGMAALRLLAPLVGLGPEQGPTVHGRARAGLERDKALTLRALKELEFDRAMGKVAEPDFVELRGLLRQRAMRLIRQLEGGEVYKTLIERDLATVPDDERIDVVPTPEYLRNVVPFAAYFEPAAFDKEPKGIYIVTPSVGHDPNAMREHNFSSISNTSIHEAYPGHHLQLDVARRNGSLTRLMADAPEFVEGWGMYSELMMREHGFDDGPAFRVIMHTDAIWRACRIILDIRLHRGELTADEATDFLVEQTNFERANARAEVQWYTYRPTYPLSYLLGRTLLLELRSDEQRRLGDRFDLKGFHDMLLRNGSLPISFHRRLLAEGT